MSAIRLEPPDGPLHAVVSLPGSKGLTNRALVMAALAQGTSVLSNALLADDTEYMMEGLRALGFAVDADSLGRRVRITGRGGHVPNGEADIFCGNSGTTIRFCCALSSLGRGRYTLDGVPRMRERPMGQLVSALQALGAGGEYLDREGFPPLTIHAQGLSGGTVTFDRPVSSQFISALLLAAPAAGNDVLIEVVGPLVSAPYVTMTAELMAVFGPAVITDLRADGARFIVPAPQAYHGCDYDVEPDASNASYFLAAPAVAGGTVTVDGLGSDSLQGDVQFVNVLEAMGCTVERASRRLTVQGPASGRSLRAVDIDLGAMPDVAPTVAVLALFADGTSVIRNVANLRLKECDRLAALAHELRDLGAHVDESSDGLAISPPDRVTPAAINTYDDHRMAMSFALVGLRVGGTVINDPECVRKTFPDFFDRWADLCRSTG